MVNQAAPIYNAFIPLREPLLNGLPVDNIPDGLEILGLAVLILEAVLQLAFVRLGGLQITY